MSNEEQNSPELDEVEGQPEVGVVEEAVVDGQVDTETTDVATLQAQLEQVQQELADTKDQALRTVAEAQNIRRRSEQDVDKARKFALEKFSGDLLPVVDNLERAIGAADLENEAVKLLVEGVELTYKSFIDALTKYSVEQIDPVAEPFDPNYHQAITMVPNPDLEPNTVMDVMQKGYSLNGRLIRPAMVVVSKAP